MIAILLPALGRARASAGLTPCLSNRSQVGNGLAYFYVHNAFNSEGTKFAGK